MKNLLRLIVATALLLTCPIEAERVYVLTQKGQLRVIDTVKNQLVGTNLGDQSILTTNEVLSPVGSSIAVTSHGKRVFILAHFQNSSKLFIFLTNSNGIRQDFTLIETHTFTIQAQMIFSSKSSDVMIIDRNRFSMFRSYEACGPSSGTLGFTAAFGAAMTLVGGDAFIINSNIVGSEMQIMGAKLCPMSAFTKKFSILVPSNKPDVAGFKMTANNHRIFTFYEVEKEVNGARNFKLDSNLSIHPYNLLEKIDNIGTRSTQLQISGDGETLVLTNTGPFKNGISVLKAFNFAVNNFIEISASDKPVLTFNGKLLYLIKNISPLNKIQVCEINNFVPVRKTEVTVDGTALALGIGEVPQSQKEPIDPPRHFKGEVILNEFLSQTDRINHLTWEPSSNGLEIEYRLYRNGKILSIISVFSGILEYDDHNRKKNKEYFYELTSVSNDGIESDPVSVTLP
ncbi:MAG: hypothetical protein H0W88_06250 [Parachlamydiaceae bacterium]|nr:hypothetical protein [Parachlamydiaceae bacterium]